MSGATPTECPRCNGTGDVGYISAHRCSECGGTGKVRSEVEDFDDEVEEAPSFESEVDTPRGGLPPLWQPTKSTYLEGLFYESAVGPDGGSVTGKGACVTKALRARDRAAWQREADGPMEHDDPESRVRGIFNNGHWLLAREEREADLSGAEVHHVVLERQGDGFRVKGRGASRKEAEARAIALTESAPWQQDDGEATTAARESAVGPGGSLVPPGVGALAERLSRAEEGGSMVLYPDGGSCEIWEKHDGWWVKR